MWLMIEPLRGIDAVDARYPDAQQVLSSLATSASADELHQALAPALTQATERAATILAAGSPITPPTTPPVVPPDVPPLIIPPISAGLPAPRHVDDIELDGIDGVFSAELVAARAALEQHPAARLRLQWWLE